MTTETMSPTRRETEQLQERNILQRKLVEQCLADGLFTKTDTKSMMEVFKLVSDIIDDPQEEHESIRQAFVSHDYDAAVKMLIVLAKEKLQK